MRTSLPLLFVFTMFFLSCSDDSGPVTPTSSGNDALILVVENNEMFPPGISNAWTVHKQTLLPMLSEFFGVSEESLKDLTFAEVIDDVGEPWTIREILEATGNAYEQTVVLTDHDATKERMISEMVALQQRGYKIDLIFSLHASSSYICFDDENIFASDLAEEIKEKGISIRALFQTCCHSGNHLDDWATTGIAAACGSRSTNYMVLFSPMGFARSWAQGNSFTTAVADAYEYELEKTRELDRTYKLPYGRKMEPTQSQQTSSEMQFCGTDTLVTIFTESGAGKIARK